MQVERSVTPADTWGIHGYMMLSIIRNRSTPTYVGNTSPASDVDLVGAVHPHTHGEYKLTAFTIILLFGPPPLL